MYRTSLKGTGAGVAARNAMNPWHERRLIRGLEQALPARQRADLCTRGLQ